MILHSLRCQVRDLLAKGPRSLEVHETGDGGVAVRGLSQFVVRSVSDIAHVLRVCAAVTTTTHIMSSLVTVCGAFHNIAAMP